MGFLTARSRLQGNVALIGAVLVTIANVGYWEIQSRRVAKERADDPHPKSSGQMSAIPSHESSALAANEVSDANPTAGTNGSLQSQLVALLADLHPTKRRAALKAFGESLGKSNPTDGWKLLSTIPGMADRQEFAEALLRAWALRAPQAAVAACRELAAGELRATSYAASLGTWAESAPREAATFAASQLEGSARSMAVTEIARTWAANDPAAAAQWAVGQSSTTVGQTAIAEVMAHWANTDPKAGATWATALPSGPFRESAVQALTREWADQYPSEAAAWAAVQPEANSLAPAVAQAWASSEPAQAAAWAASLTNEDARNSAASLVAGTWAAADPQASLAWATKQNDPTQRDAYLTAAIGTWAADNPQSAFAWTTALPPGTTREQSQDAVLQSWATTSPDTLNQWLATQPPTSRAANTARLHLADTLVETNPATALGMAQSISNPQQQESATRAVIDRWQQIDPASADVWLDKNPRWKADASLK